MSAVPSSSSAVLRVGIGAAAALVVLQILWHAVIAPPAVALLKGALLVAVVPLLPGLWAAFGSLRRGVLISGIVCLFYFAHGIAELWSGSAPRWLGSLEVVLTLVVIGALGWDSRGYKRPKKAADIA